MTVAAENRSSHFGLKRNLIVLAAIVADDLEAFRSVFAFRRLLGAAFRTTLRRHHVALVKDLLLFLGEQESFFTLNARGLDVRHMLSPFTISTKG